MTSASGWLGRAGRRSSLSRTGRWGCSAQARSRAVTRSSRGPSRTLVYSLTDSPVGQLAWIVEKFKTWSDCGDDLESSFSKDELLDNVMVYRTCAAATSSARPYWHSLASSVGGFDEVPAPSAYSRFPADNFALSERWARTSSPIYATTARPHGAVIRRVRGPCRVRRRGARGAARSRVSVNSYVTFLVMAPTDFGTAPASRPCPSVSLRRHGCVRLSTPTAC
jgi:hypothetical protein